MPITARGELPKIVYSRSARSLNGAMTRHYEGIILVLITVPSDLRRQGHARALMSRFVDMCGDNAAYLEVSAIGGGGLDNAGLVTLYGEYGFVAMNETGFEGNTIMGLNAAGKEDGEAHVVEEESESSEGEDEGLITGFVLGGTMMPRADGMGYHHELVN